MLKSLKPEQDQYEEYLKILSIATTRSSELLMVEMHTVYRITQAEISYTDHGAQIPPPLFFIFVYFLFLCLF